MEYQNLEQLATSDDAKKELKELLKYKEKYLNLKEEFKFQCKELSNLRSELSETQFKLTDLQDTFDELDGEFESLNDSYDDLQRDFENTINPEEYLSEIEYLYNRAFNKYQMTDISDPNFPTVSREYSILQDLMQKCYYFRDRY